MNTVKFKKDGGPVRVEITSGFAQTGSYLLRLWEANENKIVMKKNGNFINDDDDAYDLPTPNEVNNGRIPECIATVAITPPIKDYSINMIISQDGQELDVETVSGSSNSPTVTVDLFVKLEL